MDFRDFKTGTCINCGATMGLHHYDGLNCPRGGIEAPVGRKQEWNEEKFEDSGIEGLKAKAPDLLHQLGIMTALCRVKYGNLDKDVYSEIEKSESLINQFNK